MSNALIYENKTEKLSELLYAAKDGGATLLIPDLQRPYKWAPNKIPLLVDSVLKGWPIGSLLLWNIRSDTGAERIPSRCFWLIVDRTSSDEEGHPALAKEPPAKYRMVLDGQQRIQSLLLAFIGGASGFKLLEKDWKETIEGERSKGRASSHWSKGSLFLDVRDYHETRASGTKVLDVDYTEVLRWLVPSADDRSPDRGEKTKSSIKDLSAFPGRYVRLSRLWELAEEKPGVGFREYQQKLDPLFEEYQLETDWRDDLADLLVEIARVKQMPVSYMQLNAFDPNIHEEDRYDEAIVNIFTRLNRAGLSLTPQEISFAWIKRKWSGPSPATTAFDNLKKACQKRELKLELDEAVQIASSVWSVLMGAGHPLRSKDLLRSNVVGEMAAGLFSIWTPLTKGVEHTLDISSELELTELFDSKNALIVLFAWYAIPAQWESGQKFGVAERDAFFKRLDLVLKERMPRWLFLTSWSRIWSSSSDKSLAKYTAQLAECKETLSDAEDSETIFELMGELLDSWLSELAPSTGNYIDSLTANSRGAVGRKYFKPLWVWHRLDDQRWKNSRVSLRHTKAGKKKKPRLDVDHISSEHFWSGLDDEDDTRHELGNTFLLEKTFNISKGKKSLSDFCKEIFEFKNGAIEFEDFCTALNITSALQDPSTEAGENLIDAIKERTERIKSELKEFVQGEKALSAASSETG